MSKLIVDQAARTIRLGTALNWYDPFPIRKQEDDDREDEKKTDGPMYQTYTARTVARLKESKDPKDKQLVRRLCILLSPDAMDVVANWRNKNFLPAAVHTAFAQTEWFYTPVTPLEIPLQHRDDECLKWGLKAQERKTEIKRIY